MLTVEALETIKKERISYLQAELKRVKDALIAAGARKIILFGSAARGELGLFSDIDLIAVMPSRLPFVDRMQGIYRKMHPASMDLFVYTPAEFGRMSRTNPFLKSAIREGQTIYEKKAGRRSQKVAGPG